MFNVKRHIGREIFRISKDFTLILSLLLAPIFYAFFYGSIYKNKVEQNVKVVVVDQDHSELSKTLIRMFDESSYVDVERVTRDFSLAKRAFTEMEVQGIIYFEPNFEVNIKKMHGADLALILNTSKFLPSNDIKEAVSKIVMTVGAGVRMAFFKQMGNNSDYSLTMAQPILLADHSVFVDYTNYTDFLLPGLLLLILQQTFLIGLAESISKEFEKNTLLDWFRLSENNIIRSIFGKTFFYFILYFAYAIFFLTIIFHAFGLTNIGGFVSLLILFSVFFVVLMFLASFIASFLKKEIYALQFFAFTTYPFFLLSGYAWPIEALNPLLKIFSYFIPTTHMIDAYIKIIYGGLSWVDCLPQLVNLLVLALFYGTLVYWRYGIFLRKVK